MAVLDNKFRVRGTIGNLSYRVVGSKNIIQIKPGKGIMKQTPATKECASEFGLASSTAYMIRKAFYPAIQGLSDGGMVNRFTSKVLKAICLNRQGNRGTRDLHGGELSYLENFQFNTHSPLHENLLVQPRVAVNENQLSVHLPAFDVLRELKTPDLCAETSIRILAVAFNFKKEFHQYFGHHEIVIPRGKKVQEAVDWICPEQVPAGCVILVSMSLHHWNGGTDLMEKFSLNSKELMPSAIIAAFETTGEEEVAEAVAVKEAVAEEGSEEAKAAGARFRWPMSGYRGNELIRDRLRLLEKEKPVPKAAGKGEEWIVPGIVFWKKRVKGGNS